MVVKRSEVKIVRDDAFTDCVIKVRLCVFSSSFALFLCADGGQPEVKGTPTHASIGITRSTSHDTGESAEEEKRRAVCANRTAVLVEGGAFTSL